MSLSKLADAFGKGGMERVVAEAENDSLGYGEGDRDNALSSIAGEYNAAREKALPDLYMYDKLNKKIDVIKGIRDGEKLIKEIKELRDEAWHYANDDLGLDIYGKDKKKFEKVYGAYKDMSDPGGPMQQETRKLREEKAATNDPAAKAKLETKIQTIEKYYGDRYDKLRHRMMNYSRVRTLDFSNRFLERMDNLKIQGYVKQIVNRIDYTNAHVDARVLREINRDQGFIKLVKEGNFQLIADSLNEAAQAARAGADIPKSNPLGAVLKEKIAKWAEGDNTVGFLDHVDSLAGNYRQFVGNPDGPTRGGGFTAAKNAVAAMLRIEVVKEVAGRLKKYADSEGSDEQSYRRNIDAFVKKLDMYKNSKNFEPFFKMTFGTPPVRCDDPDRGFIAVIRRKRDGTEPKQGDPDDPNSDDEAGRLAEQIKFLQSYNGPNSNYPGCPPKDEKEAYKDMSNTDIGIVRQMATISYDIDVANEKSDHQDYANEEVRKMMEKYYLPIKKLEAFKGSSGGDKEK